MLLFYLSGQNETERQLNNESEKAFVKTKEYVWREYKEYKNKSKKRETEN